MIPIPLWIFLCRLQIRAHLLARTISFVESAYIFDHTDNVFFWPICLCSMWQLRSSAYYPEYGIGAFGTLPLLMGNRYTAYLVSTCKSCVELFASFPLICMYILLRISCSKSDRRYYFLLLPVTFRNNGNDGVMFMFSAGCVQKILESWV